jgi:hypothetical protein
MTWTTTLGRGELPMDDTITDQAYLTTVDAARFLSMSPRTLKPARRPSSAAHPPTGRRLSDGSGVLDFFCYPTASPAGPPIVPIVPLVLTPNTFGPIGANGTDIKPRRIWCSTRCDKPQRVGPALVPFRTESAARSQLRSRRRSERSA